MVIEHKQPQEGKTWRVRVILPRDKHIDMDIDLKLVDYSIFRADEVLEAELKEMVMKAEKEGNVPAKADVTVAELLVIAGRREYVPVRWYKAVTKTGKLTRVYQQSTEPSEKPERVCIVEGCEKEAWSKEGMCRSCAMKKMKAVKE